MRERTRCPIPRHVPGAVTALARTRRATRAAAILAVLVAGGCRVQGAALPAPIPALAAAPVTAFEQRHVDIRPGTGALAEPRKCIYAHYTGWLTDGTKFDSSRDTTAEGQPREPIGFAQGARRVIVGWDVGFEGMRVGAQRRLIIPYQLAYGVNGRPPVIPPRATLIFDVELMAIADTLPRAEPGPPGTPPQCPRWADVRGAGSAGAGGNGATGAIR